jgi:peptidyl-tRNA hydrolase
VSAEEEAPGVTDAARAAQHVRELLQPLRLRQRQWAAGRADEPPEDETGEIWAQPLVVRLEKASPPERAAVLQAAARAALAVLADPRADVGGPWEVACRRWLAGRIRKVARRARGAAWDAVERLAGVGVDQAGAQVRAFPPCPTTDLPRELARLQVGGTDVPGDLPADGPSGRPTLWVSPEEMTAGKLMAQVGHASMLLAAYLPETELTQWIAAGLPLAVCRADLPRWSELNAGPADPEERWAASATVVVRDAGFTEIAPGTVTVVAERG